MRYYVKTSIYRCRNHRYGRKTSVTAAEKAFEILRLRPSVRGYRDKRVSLRVCAPTIPAATDLCGSCHDDFRSIRKIKAKIYHRRSCFARSSAGRPACFFLLRKIFLRKHEFCQRCISKIAFGYTAATLHMIPPATTGFATRA